MESTHSTRRFIGLGIILIIVLVIATVLILEPDRNPLPAEPLHGTDSALSVLEADSADHIPSFLKRSFPDTDFSTADPALQNALSGGPPKDGIPALTDPEFIPITAFDRADTIQAIVMKDDEQIKVYPYNILNWHEIVNDTVAGVPVAITFCPLCGSAIVFDRTLPDGTVTTFGVSGGLLESNMIMYDRSTESLWQQSTGKGLAGEHVGAELSLVTFQLMSIGDIKERWPDALVLSENTGHIRAYGRNPYSGYDEDNDQFIFAPSSLDARFPAKEIMVVFRVDETAVATPWLAFADGTEKEAVVGEETVTLKKEAGELTITDSTGKEIPFYFEMWFSFAVQHENGVVIQ